MLTVAPHQLVPRDVKPDSIAGWKAVVDDFLTDEACAFHRNVEISSPPACHRSPSRAVTRDATVTLGSPVERPGSDCYDPALHDQRRERARADSSLDASRRVEAVVSCV